MNAGDIFEKGCNFVKNAKCHSYWEKSHSLFVSSLQGQGVLPDDFGPISIDSHGHNGACLARREGQFSKFRLLHADFIIAVQSTPAEIFTPVGVLVVDHQQSEASVFAI